MSAIVSSEKNKLAKESTDTCISYIRNTYLQMMQILVVVVDLYVDHNASGIIVVSNITSEMTPEKSRK